MNELALFAGAGGGILGGKLLGWRTVCAVEWEPYPASVLIARQNDGCLEPFPIWNDVQTFDGKPWAGRVDVVSGGFPCQDISVAGTGAGITGERSGMWSHMARVIGEVRPRFAFVENSPALLTRGLGTVLSDLAALGYDCKWTVLGANHCGGPHERARIWILADSLQNRRVHRVQPENDGKEGTRRDQKIWGKNWQFFKMGPPSSSISSSWPDKPEPSYLVDELGSWVDKLAATGNGQVPIVAATAWRMLGGPIA